MWRGECEGGGLPPHPRPLSPCGGEGGGLGVSEFLLRGVASGLVPVIAGGEQRCGEGSARVVFPLTPDPSPPAGARGGSGVSEFFLRGFA